MTVTALVDLTADVLPHLNMVGNEPPEILSEIQGFINGTTPVIEDMVGHVIPVTYDEKYDGGSSEIYLRQLPVLSVTSVTETIGLTVYGLTSQPVGSTTDAFGFSLENPTMGRLVRRDGGGAPLAFYRNVGNVEVVYQAGMASVPQNVRLATLELVRHWYQSSQQASTKVGSYAPGSSDSEGTDSYTTTPSGYLVPNRVKELLAPSMRPVVIA